MERAVSVPGGSSSGTVPSWTVVVTRVYGEIELNRTENMHVRTNDRKTGEV